jgi:hypothetical protein
MANLPTEYQATDRATFQDWLNENRARDGVAPIYRVLDNSGYAADKDFTRRHADNDPHFWRWFFVRRDVPRVVFNAVWRRFLRETGR